MSLSPRLLHILKLSSLLLFLLLPVGYILSGRSNLTHHDYKQLVHVAVSGKKATFVQSALEYPIDGKYDNSSLAQLCGEKQWVPGLIFKCESPQGGVANVRNMILNCVRYTIEAGATGLVIPEILLPTTGKTSTPVPLTHYFDLPHFTTHLSTSCPQIQIYNHKNDLYDLPTTAKPILLDPLKLDPAPLLSSILSNPSVWNDEFKDFLNGTHPTTFSAEKPILVSVHPSLLQFPLSYDLPLVVSTFGHLLIPRLDIRRLASTILYRLSEKHNLGIHPQEGVEGGTFYGAHLRTGPDAEVAGWTPGAIQSQNYLSEAEKFSLQLVYLSCPDAASITAFTTLATNLSIAVETAQSLLSNPATTPLTQRIPVKGYEKEWIEYGNLNWDQQVLVDSEVLLRSSIFGGIWESSFSWGVAMRRHVLTSGINGWENIFEDAGAELVGGKTRRSSDSEEEEEEREHDIPDDPRSTALTLPYSTSESWHFSPPNSDSNSDHASNPSSKSRLHIHNPFTINLSLKRTLTHLHLRKRLASSPPPPPPSTARTAPPPLSAIEKELVAKQAASKRKGPPASEVSKAGGKGKGVNAGGRVAVLGEVAWKDRLSTVFGPRGEGKRVRGSLWP